MDGPGALIGIAISMPIAPHFDSPYMSASITEFWSKRWNLTIGNALRFLVFDPVHEGMQSSTKRMLACYCESASQTLDGSQEFVLNFILI